MNPFKYTTLSRHLDLLHVLVSTNLKVKYQRSALGFLWTLLQPALMALLLISVFSYIVRIPMTNYWAFLISGYMVWNFILQCINGGVFIFVEHANVVRSISLPKEVLVVSAVISRLFEFIGGLLVVVVILVLAHHKTVPASFLVLPVLFVFQIALTVGIAFPLSIISVWYYDVQYALSVIVIALFYVSPVFYPVSMVPEGFRSVYLINPIAQVLELYHVALYEGKFPSVIDLSETALTSLIVLILGYLFFYRYQSSVAEIV